MIGSWASLGPLLGPLGPLGVFWVGRFWLWCQGWTGLKAGGRLGLGLGWTSAERAEEGARKRNGGPRKKGGGREGWRRMAEGGRDEGGVLACKVSFLSAFDCGNGLSCDGGETASCNGSESVNGGRGGGCSVGDVLLLRGCYCSGNGDSQGVKPQRRNLQHGEDDMRRVFGIMIMCLVAERRRWLRGRLAGNQGARQKKKG